MLHYTPGFHGGGIESRLLDWYRNMDREKVQFFLIKLNQIDNTEDIKEFLSLGGKFFNLPPFNLTTGLRLEKMIYNIIVEEKIDIVHVHDTNSGLFALKAAKRANVKCRILHSRTTNFLPNEKNKIIKQAFMKIAPKFATDYFACSFNAGIWGCGKNNADEIVVIKNGIQDDRYQYNSAIRMSIRKELGIENKFVVGTVSRLSPQKNIPFLIKIFNDYYKIDNNSILLIVGGGDEQSVIDEINNYPEIKNNVIIAGPKKNIWDYYMAMDIFCGTSFYEGFGTTAIEAQASGLPTLLSQGFPAEIEVTNFVRRLDIVDTEEWIRNIKEFKNERYSESGIKSIAAYGYSAKKVAKDLENFYLEHYNEFN
ncbi:glycosyltransferase [Streptococcus suis]|uniref:glycosyltransferase n=1 Tax=Streptococcus suis TaxID=1307 RepID=UPI002002C419|nr:glycosyltransferase [Streptococcus suis]MCQ8272276.1 glycosyltransferase [Streptococcus suis]NQK32115.1 glycosyltransferase [Streptococcus suis]UUM50566.1 glycosyltransferase [Streptococcus suis]WNF82442.1 glycosyltransferase [Streptococcus suis]HEM4802731.1 glycosyltransferase [Streptococcus suis]